MKRCPECKRDYNDDSLSFCLDDGSELLFGPSTIDEPGTAIIPTASSTDPDTQIFTSHADKVSVETHKFVSSKSKWIVAGAIGVVLFAICGIGGYWLYVRGASRQIESIAVMPFLNESGNADIEYLSDGMTETLIGSLSHIPNLYVKPRSSVFRYKGKDLDLSTIGKELNVQAILTGRVVQRGEQLTLSLELVDVQKDNVIWTEQYVRSQSDLVSLQTEIARDVSSKLQTRLSGADQQMLAKTYTADPVAYQLYLKGRYYWNKRTAENIRKAIEQFQQAVDTDPNYALAYAGLADCFVVMGDYSGTPESETVPKMQAFAKRALELDNSLAEAHASLAYSYVQTWQWEKGEQEFKRAIELNPSYPTAHHWYGLCLVELGRTAEAFAEIKRAQELDPLAPVISYNVATFDLYLGDVNSSIIESKKVIELDPNFARTHSSLGLAYLKQQRFAEAIAELKRAVELSPNDRQLLRDLGYGLAIAQRRTDATAVINELETKYSQQAAYGADIAGVYGGLGDMDQAFAWLDKDINTRSGRLGRVFYQLVFEEIRHDPRYADMRRRMGAKPLS
jgi:TolB-like protein/Flp pilus assembly protein TadD